MTEFRSASDCFEQDPIALRHCILYDFVQGKPVDTAYTELCEKFPGFYGKLCEVIEKEELEYWFDQFKQGKFGDDKEPVADMKEILRSDKKALRACILSESLERQFHRNSSRPYSVSGYDPHRGFILPNIRYDERFNKYRHFREVLGKDAMDYREFWFWMERFYCEEFDLGYEGEYQTFDFEEAGVDIKKFEKYLEMIDRLSKMFKDPIILRYCLLFEFLKHRPIEQGYQNFCRKVGEKLMDFDTFQYWFNQFKQGIFDDNKEPVADLRDILRNDQRSFRICILYASLNYCSISEHVMNKQTPLSMVDQRFQSYSYFCDIVGENVMKYEKFVYWQFRFSDGKFDSDHERNLENKKDLELIDMPIDVMKSISQYLDIGDMEKLRKTCTAFRTFIASQPLYLKRIFFCFKNLHGSYSWRIAVCSSNSYKTYAAIYTDNQQNKYPFEFDWESRLVDREDYEKCAIEDMKLIFKTPNLHSEHLRIETYGSRLYDAEKLIDEIQTQNNILDGLASVIDPSAKPHIKSIHIKNKPLEPIVDFLSYLEPGYLNCISLDFEYTHGTGFSKMLELEQFKQAKEFSFCSMPFAGSIRDLLHFDRFWVNMATFSAEDFRILREVAFKSSTFKDCRLEVKGQFDFNGIRRELDPLVPGTSENTFCYLIPNTDDCFEISINTSGIYVFKKEDYREKDRREMEMNDSFD